MTTVRPLEPDDLETVQRLSAEAFGRSSSDDPWPSSLDLPGRHFWGTEDHGDVVAVAVGREYESWFGGVTVPTCGISSVTVAAEHRGHGLVADLVGRVVDDARSRGALISTLFPTAPGIYRRLGYEIVTSLDFLTMPTTALDLSGPCRVTRRATADDVAGIHLVYDRWARAQNGPLTRRGVSFPDALNDAVTAFTVVEDAAGEVSGFAAWDRGPGYGADATMTIWDLLADDVGSLRALCGVIASFAAVAPTAVLRTSGLDPVRHLLRSAPTGLRSTNPYMLRVLDLAAFERLDYPDDLEVTLPFSTADGHHLLTVEGGHATISEVDPGDRELTPAGLALTFAGAQSASDLRRLGHLTGGDPADDTRWDHLFGGRGVHVRDYF